MREKKNSKHHWSKQANNILLLEDKLNSMLKTDLDILLSKGVSLVSVRNLDDSLSKFKCICAYKDKNYEVWLDTRNPFTSSQIVSQITDQIMKETEEMLDMQIFLEKKYDEANSEYERE